MHANEHIYLVNVSERRACREFVEFRDYYDIFFHFCAKVLVVGSIGP